MPDDQSPGVLAEFDETARAYDRLVGRNPGYHRHLALSARRMGVPGGGRGLHLLDVGCGTGASTAALLRAAPHARITAVDGSESMLACAQEKSWPESVRFVHAPLEDLAEAGVDGPFDGILAAYLVRNLHDPDLGVRMLRDLLSPGAPLAVHEYTLEPRPHVRALWSWVCWTVIIPLGKLATGKAGLYRYLWRSVLDFDGPARLARRLSEADFTDVEVKPMDGWQRDIVHTVLGRRSQEKTE